MDNGSLGVDVKHCGLESAGGFGVQPRGRASVWVSVWSRALVLAEGNASNGVLWEATFCTGEGTTVEAVEEEGGGTVSVAVPVDTGPAAVLPGAE